MRLVGHTVVVVEAFAEHLEHRPFHIGEATMLMRVNQPLSDLRLSEHDLCRRA